MQDQLINEVSLHAPRPEPIPFGLREFGNIPPNSVSAWVAVREKDLGKIALQGIKITDSKREINNKTEEIFDEEAQKAGKQLRRRQCVFATPLPPEKMRYKFSGVGDIVLEIKIDQNSGKEMLVADGEKVTEASDRLNSFGVESAHSWAKSYWNEATTLKQYTEEQKRIDTETNSNDYDFIETFPPNAYGFVMPEILIPSDIPAARIRVHSTKK